MNESENTHVPVIKKFFKKMSPPLKWRFPVIILLGIFTGLITFIIVIAEAPSYLSDKPEVCINCHVMIPQFATWERGSHGRVALCNDCHVPQNHIINKYLFKAKDGLRHSYMFTLRLEPQVMQIKEAGKEVVQENCKRCHANVIHPISVRAMTGKSIMEEGEGYCWRCHRETPHGKVTSLSSTPHVLVPGKESVIPPWMENNLKIKQ